MISIFELFKVGIGPSSSHTVGPMKAANCFIEELKSRQFFESTFKIQVNLYGSLALTGKGHGTDKALLLGLESNEPDRVEPDFIESRVGEISSEKKLKLSESHSINFDPHTDLIFLSREVLPHHSNGMKFFAFDVSDNLLFEKVYYSVGGGFVVDEKEAAKDQITQSIPTVPFPFKSGQDLLRLGKANNLTIAEIIRKNENKAFSDEHIDQQLLHIWQVMQNCVRRGFNITGELPGGLRVKRRASRLYRQYTETPEKGLQDPLSVMDWINLYALAVNEENAAGGRVVTAPTNGAAGIIPAVLHYYARFIPHANETGVIRFLLTAGAIGILYKLNSSISGAEVGCQGEVGVACSMAAAGLVGALNGTNMQIEYAAEIGMEHNLGLTCDPVMGLVQIPCIERNAMAAVKAINAARMALQSDGEHKVSLDQVIETMRQTGQDMMTQYKETSQGGLAVNVTEC